MPHPKTLQVALEQWTRRNGKKRTQEYRIVKELNAVDAWRKYKDILKQNPSAENARKCNTKSKYKKWKKRTLALLSHSSPKRRSCAKAELQETSKWNPPLNGGLFTAFISKMCEDEIDWRPGQCLFEALGELGPLLWEALEKSPVEKSPGEDEMKTEMLKFIQNSARKS